MQYAMLFSKDFKAANMNILKAAFSIAKTVISSCNAGPRACQPVILAALAKIHDKKLGSELFTLLSVIAEKIGPDAVVAQVPVLAPSPSQFNEGMAKSRVPAQQKAVLQYLRQLVEEFGATSLSLKPLLAYVMSPLVLSPSLCHLGSEEHARGREEQRDGSSLRALSPARRHRARDGQRQRARRPAEEGGVGLPRQGEVELKPRSHADTILQRWGSTGRR